MIIIIITILVLLGGTHRTEYFNLQHEVRPCVIMLAYLICF